MKVDAEFSTHFRQRVAKMKSKKTPDSKKPPTAAAVKSTDASSPEKYHVALSFAGEDRPYVDKVAARLQEAGVLVFYDRFEETNLWGKDLYTYLSDVYQDRALYTVIFVSQAYATKLWTNHERKAAQARAFSESREYLLPAVFDSTVEIPGLLKTTGHIDLSHLAPEDFAGKGIARLSVESSGSQITHFTTPFSARQRLSWKASRFPAL